MQTHDSFIESLIALIGALESEIAKYDRRIAAAQEARGTKQRKLEAAKETLNAYRELHNLPTPPPVTVEVLRERWKERPTRDLIVEYARLHGGRFNVRQAAETLVAAGLYKDVRNASGNIYATLDRHPALARKLRRGEYIVEFDCHGRSGGDDPSQSEDDPSPPLLWRLVSSG